MGEKKMKKEILVGHHITGQTNLIYFFFKKGRKGSK